MADPNLYRVGGDKNVFVVFELLNFLKFPKTWMNRKTTRTRRAFASVQSCKIWDGVIVMIIVIIVTGGKQSQILLCRLRTKGGQRVDGGDLNVIRDSFEITNLLNKYITLRHFLHHQAYELFLFKP